MIVERGNVNAVIEAVVRVEVFCTRSVEEVGPGGDAPQLAPSVVSSGRGDGSEGIVVDTMGRYGQLKG